MKGISVEVAIEDVARLTTIEDVRRGNTEKKSKWAMFAVIPMARMRNRIGSHKSRGILNQFIGIEAYAARATSSCHFLLFVSWVLSELGG